MTTHSISPFPCFELEIDSLEKICARNVDWSWGATGAQTQSSRFSNQIKVWSKSDSNVQRISFFRARILRVLDGPGITHDPRNPYPTDVPGGISYSRFQIERDIVNFPSHSIWKRLYHGFDCIIRNCWSAGFVSPVTFECYFGRKGHGALTTLIIANMSFYAWFICKWLHMATGLRGLEVRRSVFLNSNSLTTMWWQCRETDSLYQFVILIIIECGMWALDKSARWERYLPMSNSPEISDVRRAWAQWRGGKQAGGGVDFFQCIEGVTYPL